MGKRDVCSGRCEAGRDLGMCKGEPGGRAVVYSTGKGCETAHGRVQQDLANTAWAFAEANLATAWVELGATRSYGTEAQSGSPRRDSEAAGANLQRMGKFIA